MVSSFDSHEAPYPSPDEVKNYLIAQLDVSPDVHIVEPRGLLTVVGAALTERENILAFNDPLTQRTIDTQYVKLHDNSALPSHLQSKGAFTARYHELVGSTSEGHFACEVLTTIAQNRQRPPAEVQRQFEYGMAHITTAMLQAALREQPDMLETICLDTAVGISRTAQGKILETGDGLRWPLPSSHANVIQGGPTVKDAVARCSEIGRGGWEHIAMLSSTHYNAELVRSVARAIFNLSPQKRVLAASDGLAGGCEAVTEAMKSNKRIKSGFGAMLLSDVNHLPREDIAAAIEAALRLLQPRGVLLISDLCSFRGGEGSVFDLINQAQAVFGHEPDYLGPMTTDDDGEGRQALFIK
jgi:hypothetical protein